MSTQVIVDLPDELLQRANDLAMITHRKLSDVLVDTLDLSLPAIFSSSLHIEPVDGLSNQSVLALTKLEMNPVDDKRVSELLYRQQAGQLFESERLELARLMQIYQAGLLRKAQALAEAVKRGLLPPLTSS